MRVRTKYLYCNIGYALLGVALGRAAGQPFTEYVREHILQPLGMTSSGFSVNASMRPLLARGYDVRDGKIDWSGPDAEWEGRGYRVPNGGLISTMRDMAKFVAWELGGGPDAILARAAQRENYSRVLVAQSDMFTGYGVGFQVNRRRSGMVALGHGGTTSGFLSQAYFDPDSKTGVIVFRSVTGSTLNPLRVAMQALEIAGAARKRGTE